MRIRLRDSAHVGLLLLVMALLTGCGSASDEPAAVGPDNPVVRDFSAFTVVLVEELDKAFNEPVALYRAGQEFAWQYQVTGSYKIEVHETTNLAAPFRATVRVDLVEHAAGEAENPNATLVHALSFEKHDGRWMLTAAVEEVPRRKFREDILTTHGYDEVSGRIRTAVEAARQRAGAESAGP